MTRYTLAGLALRALLIAWALALIALFATAPRATQTTRLVDPVRALSAGSLAAPWRAAHLPLPAAPRGARSDDTGASVRDSVSKLGIASFVAPSYGSTYLALPGGRGITVTIYGPAGSVVRRSTDAGPDRERQRAGLVADLSFADFRKLCGCDPWLVGHIRVRVVYGGARALPATDS